VYKTVYDEYYGRESLSSLRLEDVQKFCRMISKFTHCSV